MPNQPKSVRLLRARILAGAVATALVSFTAGYVVAGQPHMHNALDSLQTARSELQASTHNKGGHRVKAIALVDSAIAQVRRGIADGAE